MYALDQYEDSYSIREYMYAMSIHTALSDFV